MLQNDRVEALRKAVDTVIKSEHPAADAVAEIISHVDLDLADSESTRPNCVLILRRDGVEGVRQWVTAENLCADVVSLTEAKAAPPWNHAIIFGPPERYVSSAWLRGPQAAATAGWLIFAPPAKEVTVLTWAGHQRLTDGGYAPWAGALTATITSKMDKRVREEAVPYFYPEVPLAATPSFEHEGGERVEAQGFQFQSGEKTLLSYFSRNAGPKPLTLLDDDGIELVRAPIASLKVGDCVVFKTSLTAVDAVDKTTTEWFIENHDKRKLEKAIDQQSILKAWLQQRLDDVGSHQLEADLVAHGIARNYARMLPARVLRRDFIAPQHYRTYQNLCIAIGKRPSEDAFALLKTLRTGRRGAGVMLANRMARRLSEIPDLGAALRETGAHMLTSSGVEGVALMVVRNVAVEQILVPASQLGTLITEDGRTWRR